MVQSNSRLSGLRSYRLPDPSLPDSLTSSSKREFLILQTTFRVLTIIFIVIAISVMVTSSQSIVMFGFTFKASYSYSSALKFLVGAEAVVCVFSALSLIFVYLQYRSESHPTNYFFLFLHDMAMMILMISGCAAVTAVGYIGRYGEVQIGWGSVCDRVSKFCNRTVVSMVFSYLAFFAYLTLTIVSATKLRSRATE
ncbi:hypothetical protein ACB098_01G241200 [Castanea mollissima]